LDDLKNKLIAATTFWHTVGCPQSGAVNDNRLQWNYRYKLTIKQAKRNANQAFNNELFEYFSAKDDDAFWQAWRKRYCSSSLKTTSNLNGKQGDVNVYNEFTEEFRTVFQTNTVNSDCIFEEEFLKLAELVSDDTSCLKNDIELSTMYS